LANWGREGRYFTQILAGYRLGMNKIECGVCGLMCRTSRRAYRVLYLEAPTEGGSERGRDGREQGEGEQGDSIISGAG